MSSPTSPTLGARPPAESTAVPRASPTAITFASPALEHAFSATALCTLEPAPTPRGALRWGKEQSAGGVRDGFAMIHAWSTPGLVGSRVSGWSEAARVERFLTAGHGGT